jgi:hypothetical protein
MRDNNILSRHIKPAARKMGLGFVNWRWKLGRKVLFREPGTLEVHDKSIVEPRR